MQYAPAIRFRRNPANFIDYCCCGKQREARRKKNQIKPRQKQPHATALASMGVRRYGIIVDGGDGVGLLTATTTSAVVPPSAEREPCTDVTPSAPPTPTPGGTPPTPPTPRALSPPPPLSAAGVLFGVVAATAAAATRGDIGVGTVVRSGTGHCGEHPVAETSGLPVASSGGRTIGMGA